MKTTRNEKINTREEPCTPQQRAHVMTGAEEHLLIFGNMDATGDFRLRSSGGTARTTSDCSEADIKGK